MSDAQSQVTDNPAQEMTGLGRKFRSKRRHLVGLLLVVLGVRLGFLILFHDQVFSGPSTQFHQAFVAMNLLAGKGIKIFQTAPATVDASDPTRLIDPERYVIHSDELLPYIRQVPGYAFFLAGLWKIFGVKLWIFPEVGQVILEIVAAWGLYMLARKFFGEKVGLLTVLVFAFLFYEARVSVIPYKDIFLLYMMLIITWCASRIFLQEGRQWLWYGLACVATGVGFYFMPSIVLYPVFLTFVLWGTRRIRFGAAVTFLLIAVTVVGCMAWPYKSYVHAHRGDPEVFPPLLWYNLWLGTQIRTFYSTEEERLQKQLWEQVEASGKDLEATCQDMFLRNVRAHPISYVSLTLKKLFYGIFLVYGNAGDATYPTSWSNFKAQHPEAGFAAYASAYPLRVAGMVLGTVSASLLFPAALIALFLLRREGKIATGLFFLSVPLYFLLIHMFFHFEARYLTGTIAGYLPLLGYALSRIGQRAPSSAPAN